MLNVTSRDLTRFRKVAIDAAEAAGALISSEFGNAFAVDAKGFSGDVVTSLDRDAERLIISRLRSAFPTHAIVSEESGPTGVSGGPWTWLVDPLDGSNNIAVGLPVAAIGLALCYEGRPLVGVVHEPFAARTWSAESGGGAWQADGHPLLRRPPRAKAPVVSWTQGYGITPDDRTAALLRAALQRYGRRVLELWAPLCSWVMLARGDIDGIVGYRIGELDLHAGAVIAAATGVHIRSFDGKPFDARFFGLEENRCLVAAVPDRMAELLDLVSAQLPDPAEVIQ